MESSFDQQLLLALFTLTMISCTLLVIIFVKLQKTSLDDIGRQIKDSVSDKFFLLIQENREQEKTLRIQVQWFMEKLEKAKTSSLDAISDKVEKRLQHGFEKTNETFANIIERLAKIDQAQKNIEQLSTDVVSLQDILSDSKQRWIFGEIQLHTIIANIFGEKNDTMYQMQYHFAKQNVIVDCIVNTPQWILSIDAKFPLTNRQKIQDKTLSHDDKKKYLTAFRSGIKKQIDDIASKYIIPHVTLPTALLFLPAEAIFSHLHTDFQDIIDYAHSKHITIVSPTTLLAMMSIILSVIHSTETQKQAKVIQIELTKLHTEFERFGTRWSKLKKDFHSVGKDFEAIDVTSDKILRKFTKIESLELEE